MTKKAKRLLLLLLLISLVFAYGTFFYPHGANEFSGGSLEPPSLQHIFGTDDLGIDIFAQLSRGYWDSLFIGILAALISFVLGGAIGIAAGYFGGAADTVLSFFINLFLSVPQLPVMIVLGAFFGQSKLNIILVVSLFSWASIAKIVRAKTVSIRSQDYIRLARSYGGGFFYVLRTHMLREIFPVLAVNAVGVVGKAIIQEASLAYLGLSDPTSRSWGLMINKAMAFRGIYYTDYWKWWLMAPLLCLVITVLCIRLVTREFEKQSVRGTV